LSIALVSTLSAEVSIGRVDAGNQLRYSLSEETNEEIFEDYFDIDYENGIFRARFRYEAFQPSEETRDRQGFVYRAVGAEKGPFTLWGGHFYELFGRGLAFRGYEDRDLRIDTSLDGFNLSGATGPVRFKGFSGRTAGESRVFHGADLELRAHSSLTVGGSYLNRREPATTGYNRIDTELGCVRGSGSMGPVDLYCELGHRSSVGERGRGTAAYATRTSYLFGAGIGLEYKNYWNMSLTAEGKEYTTPPPAYAEHSWALLARRGREVDSDDERGVLGRIDWQGEGLWGFAAAYAFTEDHGDQDPEDSINLGDIGDLLDGETLFQEASAEIRVGEYTETPITLVGGWTEDYLGTISSGGGAVEDRREYLTLIAEGHFPVYDRYSGRVQLSNQHTNGDAVGSYDLTHLEFELTKSPGISVALVCEFTNASKVQRELTWLHEFEERTTWVYAQTTLDIAEGHQIRIMAGSRPEGKVCAGGACRIVPEFKGVELSMVSIF
jgi:hypothetical protein